jgi:serine/threonine protein kinase
VEVISPDTMQSPHALQEFQDRIEQLARLEHPCLPRIRDGNVYDGQLYIVTDYVGDMTLSDWYSQSGQSCERNAVIVGDTLTAVLRYVWQHARIIHGALCPDHVLIDTDGSIRLDGVGLGTLQAAPDRKDIYTAPEQMGGWRSAAPAVDMYGLGAVMYQVATAGRGRPIPGGEPDPRSLNPRLSEKLVDLIASLMGPLPDDRPFNWLDVSLELRKIQAVFLSGATPMPAERSETARWAVKRVRARGSHYRRVSTAPGPLPA